MTSINTRLDELKAQKMKVKGLEIEVYARISRYYHLVKHNNKREELISGSSRLTTSGSEMG